MSEKSSENSESSRMSAAAEAASILRELAEPRPVGDQVKAALRRVARITGMTPVRTKALWYGEARRIDAEELDTLRAVRARREAEHRREAMGKLVAIGEALDQAAAAGTASLDRESVARFLDMLRAVGARGRAGNLPGGER